MLMQAFGFALAGGVLFTSLAMIAMGGRWQSVEVAAYGADRRPWWFWLGSAAVIALYLAALASFITTADRTWAGWILMVVIPLGWGIKGTLVTFNPKGRQAVTSISGDTAWVKVAAARLPIALVLALLSVYAV
jgi:hypothetical protein